MPDRRTLLIVVAVAVVIVLGWIIYAGISTSPS
jgi:hypothetical protein